VLAIRRAAAELGTRDLTGCLLYASCDPCPMCLGAYRWSRADALYVAATSEDAAAVGFDDAAFHAAGDPPVIRLLRVEAATMMRRWLERDLPTY
jgi:guanine deaminase